MEMPKTCFMCPFMFARSHCSANLEIEFNDKNYSELFGRHKDCPLVHLPEKHGRLIDAREVLEKADKAPWFDGDVSELGLLLGSEVTTIIEAEGGGE